ncbi:hypothetical protein [Streptomyces sp. NPDC093589]|uniref:hypothetical protein n=1 Tax=Streptomyces sp. NPDC093589 TaxID=3366043 RepID=UPI003814050D
MNTRTRRKLLVVLPVAFMMTLSACEDGSTAERHEVFGLRDDLRHVSKKTQPATRPHMVQVCRRSTKPVPHTATSRVGGVTKTRRWTTIETVPECRLEPRGTETYTHVVRAERWCVELDRVGGKRRDDVWFRVDAQTYTHALKINEGKKITFTPRDEGC